MDIEDFSFHHYLSFVERFVENMLSRKCLIFNTTFCIFNKSTKIWGLVRPFNGIGLSPSNKLLHTNVSVLIHDSTTATNQQARGHSAKGGCSSTEL